MIDKERAVQMRQDGMTYREIGEEFGVSKQRIEQILKKAGRSRKHSTAMEKIPYEGLYNWLMANPRVTFPTLARLLFCNSDHKHHAQARNFAYGMNCSISKQAYDRLLAVTGMTYEELFRLRDGFKEAADG